MRVMFIFPNSPIVSDPCCEAYNPAKLAPTELLYSAGNLRDEHEVAVLDAKAEEMSMKQVEERIENFNPDIVAMWTINMTSVNDVKILEIAKKYNAFNILVMNAPVLLNQLLERFSYIDAAVYDERTFVIKDVAHALSNGGNLKDIKGIVYRENGHIIDNGKPLAYNHEEMLMPAYDLAPMDKYNKKYITVSATRGCPHLCTFCAWGRTKVKYRKVEQVLDELDMLVNNYGYNHIGFQDLTFTFSKQNTLELMEGIIRRRIKFRWFCSTRVNANISMPLLKKMKQAGCYRIFYGVEHVNDQILKNIKKFQTKKEIMRAIKLTKKAGIHPITPFIIGLPGETKDSLKELIRFIIKVKPRNYHVIPAIPYPGTELFEQVKKNDWLIVEEKPEMFWTNLDYSNPMFNIPPYTQKDLLRMCRILQIVPRLHPVMFYNTVADIYDRGGWVKIKQLFDGAIKLIFNKPSERPKPAPAQ